MMKSFIQKIINRHSYIEAATQESANSTFTWNKSADLVVVGFGGAGAAAAIEAHDQGLDVLALDRFEGGGATTISGGVYYAGGGTATQKAAGFEDSSENMFNYLKQEVQGAVSDKTLRRFCQQSLENYDWMVENGVPFEASYCDFKTSYPPNHLYFYYSGNESFPPYSDHAKPVARGHRAKKKGVSGMAIFQPLKASALKKGIKIQNHCKVIGLVQDENQRVTGVKTLTLDLKSFAGRCHQALGHLQILLRYMALFWPPLFPLLASWSEKVERRFGKLEYIQAKQGVVLATGGFYSNQAMIAKHAPNFLGGSPLGTITDDGSGIQIAQDLGAKTALMDSVSAWRFFNPPYSFVKGVLVGPSGKRICNEMLYGAQIGEQMMRDHEGKAWVILDEKTYKAAYRDLSLKKGLWFHVMLGGFYMKLGMKKANSIEQLAAKLHIEPAALKHTIDNYNAMAGSGQPDPMGKPKDNVQPLTGKQFYAINASYDYFYVPCPSLTLGGLVVNEDSGLVKHQSGQDIQGLYAAGRSAVGIPSKGYVSGLSIADCIFSGRRAAQHAAEQNNHSQDQTEKATSPVQSMHESEVMA